MRRILYLLSTATAMLFGALPMVGFAIEPGRRVESVEFVDLAGRKMRLDQPAGKVGTIVVTRDAECPVSQRYERRLTDLAKRFRARGFDFVLLDLTPHSDGEARRTAKAIPGTRTVHRDARVIAAILRAESTAEAFVVDAGGTLQYRGAIDDQYGLDYQRAAPSERWLERALESVMRAELPRTTRTQAKGCPLALDPKVAPSARPLTYHNQISRIIQARCQACHRTGGLAPMPFENFRQIHDRRAVIDLMVSSKRMPPWSADPKVGHWANDRSLSDQDRADLIAWIKAGAPEGEPSEAPVPRRFAEGWNIGKPDLVVRIPEPFKVPAEGAVDYKNFYIKTDLPEDKWVTAIEIRPSQPKVVHHALAYLEEPGRRDLTPEELAKLKPGDPRPAAPHNGVATFYAATVPGSLGNVFPEGMGKKLPKGAWIKVEIHYQPNGRQVLDQTRVGFRFARGPLKEVESLSAFNTNLKIPPYTARHEMKAEYRFAKAGQLVSFFPHMHFRGSAFRYELRSPEGKVTPLLNVPRFDFGWQSFYQLAKPIHVVAGSTLIATAWYDNSKNNPWNPDPSKTVTWGLQTTDEMMIGYFDFAADAPTKN
jgi:hypothetical protein